MAAQSIRVLLIEDSSSDSDLVKETLGFSTMPKFEVTVCKTLGEGVKSAKAGKADVVLLDLSLPDSQGLATLEAALHDIKGLPVIVLTGNNDEALGIESLRRGAQDFFVKGEWDRDLMYRGLQFAIERHKSHKR